MDELAGEPFVVESVKTPILLVARLTEDPPPHPSIAIADFDSMTADEVSYLSSVRDRGWSGTLIALGRPEIETRTALQIRVSIPRPFGSETLRKAISELGAPRVTQPLRAIGT